MIRVSRRVFAALVIISCVSCTARTRSAPTRPDVQPTRSGPGGSPEQAAQAFLSAFDRLEWDEFRSYFADDMTMFFPFAQWPARVDGREAIEKVFEIFFREQRKRRADSGASMTQGLQPRDMKVQLVGTDGAVVSFHLGSEKTPSRRSLVLQRSDTRWKVVHWHASAVPAASKGTADADMPIATLRESILRSDVR